MSTKNYNINVDSLVTDRLVFSVVLVAGALSGNIMLFGFAGILWALVTTPEQEWRAFVDHWRKDK